MPWLTANGVTIPIRNERPGTNVVRVGEDWTAFNGGYRRGTRRRAREWPFKTEIVTPAESRALRGLLEGEGEWWPYSGGTSVGLIGGGDVAVTQNTHYSSKGLAYSAVVGSVDFPTNGWSVGVGFALGSDPSSNANSRRLGNVLRLVMFGTSEIHYTVGSPLEWTIIGAIPVKTLPGSDSWQTVAVRSDGSRWVNGVRDDLADVNVLPGGTGVYEGGILKLRGREFGKSAWTNTTAYSLGTQVFAANSTAYVHEVTTAGTSGGSMPSWNVNVGGTTVDGTVTWTNRGNARMLIGDLNFLPYQVPDSWMAGIAAHMNGRNFSLPWLWMAGDFDPDAPWGLLLEAEVDDTETITLGGDVYERLSFVLRER